MTDTMHNVAMERIRGGYCENILVVAERSGVTYATQIAEAAVDGIMRALATTIGREAAFAVVQRRVDRLGDDVLSSKFSDEIPSPKAE